MVNKNSLDSFHSLTGVFSSSELLRSVASLNQHKQTQTHVKILPIKMLIHTTHDNAFNAVNDPYFLKRHIFGIIRYSKLNAESI